MLMTAIYYQKMKTVSHQKMKTVSFPAKLSKAVRSLNVQKKLQQKSTQYNFTHKHGVPTKVKSHRPIKNKINMVKLDKKHVILEDNIVPGPPHYAYQNWEDDSNVDIPLSSISDVIVDISGFQVVDVSDIEKKHVIISDEINGDFIAGKVSRNVSKDTFGGKNQYPKVRSTVNLLQETTPTVKRGKKNSGKSSKYNLRGKRRNPLGTDLGDYAFKPGTSDEDKQTVDEGVNELVRRMEKGARRILQVLPETDHFFDVVKKTLDLESVGGEESSIATQFASGLNYWSQYHVDDDEFFCTLSCMSKEKEDNEKIIYYFVFPEYQFKIPMKPGDIIVFNPLHLHSCSNCRVKDSHIFSAYVSKKTVMTKGMMLGLDK